MRPPTENAHVVMIGPGTGVAPFRSMIKQHAGEWDKHLFFGCRNKNKDFYFGEEFSQMVGRNELTFYPAFSRDRIGRKVNYVQDLLVKEDILFNRMVYDNLPLYIYVCGRAGAMPKDVRSAVKNVLLHAGVFDTEEFLQYMIENGYYQTETY
ncbi:NADPH-dependent diflavin oxidoreductase 1 [Orchesella cincta]|nr:NADPH-dependent diflavin oxidoreductase 1 [Orchesella cincta]